MAFQYSPYIKAGALQFRSLVNVGQRAFYNSYEQHIVHYLYSTSLELAQQMIEALEATGDFATDDDYRMEPALIE